MQAARPEWRSRAWLGACLVLILVACLVSIAGYDGPTSAITTIGLAAVVAASTMLWALIRTREQRRRYDDALASWAADRAAERAAQAERLRIAADLHDLVSHGLGLITVRAAAAARMAGPGGDPERVTALADVERIGRETTTELRRMLTVLRTGGPGTTRPEPPAPLRPADTLAELTAIVRATQVVGGTTDLRADGLGNVSPGVQLTVCAVVREALQNVARHAGPTSARVVVHRDDETIVVTVEDDGPQPGSRPQPGTGHGLDGLRERVAALGGSLDAGPAGRGFRVTARMPDREC